MTAVQAVADEKDIEVYFPLVHFVIKKYRNIMNHNNIEYDDLFQVGCIGLLRAVRTFDPQRGLQFSSFAVPNITGEINNFVNRKSSLVKLTSAGTSIRNKIVRLGLVGRTPEEISSRLGVGINAVKRALQQEKVRTISLDNQISNEDGRPTSLVDMMPSNDDQTVVFVRDFMESLAERERRILQQRLAGATQSEIAREHGITQVHVSRIIARIGAKFVAYLEGGESRK